MKNVLRKTVSIPKNNQIVYCLTYNFDDENIATNLQWWIEEESQDNVTYLYRISQLISGIKANSKEIITEKTIFAQFQNLNKFSVRIEKFNTLRLSKLRKPYRNFVLLNEKEIDKKIDDYIKN
jgi:hypothetical protein